MSYSLTSPPLQTVYWNIDICMNLLFIQKVFPRDETWRILFLKLFIEFWNIIHSQAKLQCKICKHFNVILFFFPVIFFQIKSVVCDLFPSPEISPLLLLYQFNFLRVHFCHDSQWLRWCFTILCTLSATAFVLWPFIDRWCCLSILYEATFRDLNFLIKFIDSKYIIIRNIMVGLFYRLELGTMSLNGEICITLDIHTSKFMKVNTYV